MQSCAFMNGQHQQAGPLPQPSQATHNLTHNVMRNQLSETANNACLGVQPPQSACFASQNRTYSEGQMSYWQPSAGPHQAVSSEQTSKKKIDCPLITMLLTSPSTNRLSENHSWSASHELQAATQYNFHQHSATQNQPNKMTANTTYNHTNTSSHWKQKALVHEGYSSRVQDGQVVSHLQQSNVRNGYYQNASGDLTNPGLAYSRTPTSLAYEHISVSATAHNRQTAQAAHNQVHRQNNPQLGFSPSTPQAGHIMSPCQPHGNNSIPTHSSSRTQMYAAQGSSTCNNRGNSTISSNANPFNQHETRFYLSKTNEPRLTPAEHQQMLRHNVSADGSHLSYTTGHNHLPPYRRTRNAKMTKTQPVPLPVSESCDMNNTQSSSLHSGQSLAESSQSLMSRSGQLVNEPPLQNSGPNVFSFTAARDGSLRSKAYLAFLQYYNIASQGNPIGSLSGASQLMQPPKDISLQGNNTQSSVVNNPELLDRSLRGASQLTHPPKHISPQRNKTQSPVVNNPELLEMMPPVKQSDNTIHSSPDPCNTRAIAVVQPSSMEYCQSASTLSNTATNESSWDPDEVFVSPDVAKNRNCENLTNGSNLCPDNLNHLQSNKSVTSCTPASNDGALLSKSDSGPQNLTQGYALDISIAKTAGNSVLQKVPVSQNCSEDQGETVKPPPVLELSSLPTTQWTAPALSALIQKIEKAQTTTEDFTEDNFVCRILHLFWGGSCKAAIAELKMGWHKVLNRDVQQFLYTQMSSETVILSQLKRKFAQLLLNYHLLKHDEVYSELPYKSSWLNLNEQLDDIDKEFGFPVTLVNPPQFESDNQMDQAEPVNSIPEPVASEVPDKVSFPTGSVNSIPEPVASEVPDKVSFPTESVNSIPEPVASEVPDKVSFPTESVNSIPEPVVSEVPLPTEPVNCTLEPVASEVPDEVPLPTEPVNSTLEPVVSDVPHKVPLPTEPVNSIPEPVVSELPDKVLLPTELELVNSGKKKPASTVKALSTQTPSSDEAESCDPWYSFNIKVMPPEEAKHLFEQVPTEISQSKDTNCQAEKVISSCVKTEKSKDTDSTLSILEEDTCDPVEQVCCIARLVEMVTGESTLSSKCQCRKQNNDEKCTKDKEDVPTDNSLFKNSSYRIFDLTMEEENPEKDTENTNDQITICSSELCEDVIEIIDLTDDKGKHDLTRDPENIFEISNSSQSSFLSITDNEYEDVLNSENEIPIQMPKLIIELSEPKDDEDLPNSENEIPIQMPKLTIELSEPKEYEDLPNGENETPIQVPKPTIELSEPKEDDLPNIENEIPIQMPKLTIEPSEPEDKCQQEQLKSTESMQSSVSMCDDRQTKSTESGDGKQISDHEEGVAQPQLKSVDVGKSFLESKGQAQTSATADLQMSTSRYPKHETTDRKRKRLSSHDTFSPFQKKSKKWKQSMDLDSEHAFSGISEYQKNLVDAAEAQPLTSNARTAELVLFGSTRQEKYTMIGTRKNHGLFSKEGSCEVQRPPELLSVNLSPLNRKSSVALHSREQSLKQWIYDKWRRSLPPTKIRHRNKLKRQKCSSASVPSIILRRKNSEMRVWKAKKPKRHDSHGGSNTKNESNKIKALHENSILKFCVLPNTFDFKHGSDKRKESTDPASDKPDHAKEENQHSNRIILKIKGTWYPNPEKKYKPLRPSAVPKTSSLFHEFKKKYIQKISMDE
ncbi:uncharacterized protein si:ch211-106e7.2 [Acanthochromis polyacanthus]|uniref:uncharacterized protein si:ch211-106e7.2 n=1 Tax=Acanthochromis polyacanthus TaxID=80966 RepID=UPI002234CD81|nr:uncharacterized protein si:ch211-106e7.2 [Acanthochromis polyacanthus]